MLTAANPESGTIGYQYDGNGNLTHKQDARGVDTSYSYDYLNRPTTRTYDDGTPTVTYTYDGSGVPFGKGRLASVSSSVSTTSYTKYDATGKVLESSQTTDGLAVCTGSSAACLMTYKYNLAGALTEETYPSGRIVHHNYAPDGKLAATGSRVTANRPFKAYAQNFTYNAAGAVTDMQLGNMRWESTEFNARLQPTKIALGTTAGADDMLDLAYGYGSTANNGNVVSQTISVDDVGTVHGFLAEQTYTYDELNRLKSATEMNTPNSGSQSQSWKQTYSFDRFGNRRFDTTSGATTTIPGTCSTAVCNPIFDLSNNRFASGQGYSYDSAGNVTQDADGKKFVYDGENKQKSFGTGGDDDNGGTYFYDGDGRRVKKIVGTEVTVFVYDASGQLVAEYATTTPTSPQVSYLTADSLASPRINTDASGAIIARHDYMPYGEEIFTTGNRGAGVHYGADGIHQQFTGYERDDETGLDHAKARMFGSSLGRFTSPDNFLNSTDPANPSGWNLYVYVENNPLRFTDPTGEIIKKDGKIEFHQTGTVVITSMEKVMKDGKEFKINGKTVYTKTSYTMKVGYVVGDDKKTKINAYQSPDGGKVTTEIVDKKGKTFTVDDKDTAGKSALAGIRTALDSGGYDSSSDCHGTSFANGEVWINDPEVKKLLKADGYRQITGDEMAEGEDVAIYSSDGSVDPGKVKHSVRFNSDGTVRSKGGFGALEPRARLGPGPGTAWSNPKVKVTLWTQRAKPSN